jgi:S-adenosylmethionine:tRNA ribosyltransferase-isomerase
MSESETITFDFEVPRRLIAQEPLANRVDARLMLVDRTNGRLDHYHVRDLPELLRAGDRLVLNDTRVIPAQLEGIRAETGGRWRGLFLQELASGHWKIVCKTRGRLREGEPITLFDREMRPTAKLWLLEPASDGQWLAHPECDSPAFEFLERVGRVPLPPYIRGGRMVDADVDHYQTVFARRAGAVAAPTAGLHFSKELLKSIEQRGVGLTAVTLHVGLGTFRPIQTATLAEHSMHVEWGEVNQQAARELAESQSAGRRIVAVGTTVVRLLETAVLANADHTLHAWSGNTDLFIRPPFTFRAVDALLTNFHYPRTTLLVLVQTFGGRDLVARAYREAIRDEYRFFSYGDAMLIV